MLDIVRIENGEDLGLANTSAPKAANVVSTQIGTLEYAPDFGVDLKFFLQEGLEFQNQSFVSYIVERLSQHHISVSEVIEVVESLANRYTYKVGEGQSQAGSLIR